LASVHISPQYIEDPTLPKIWLIAGRRIVDSIHRVWRISYVEKRIYPGFEIPSVMKTEFFLLDTPGMMQTAGPQQAPI
jgi:hypothetical protein